MGKIILLLAIVAGPLQNRQQLVDKYGPIDTINWTWPAADQWLTTVKVPGLQLTDGTTVTSLTVNKDMAPALRRVMYRLWTTGLIAEISHYCGSYNVRPVRGSTTRVSIHSYALALDFNCKGFVYPSNRQWWSCEFISVWENAGFVAGRTYLDEIEFRYLKPRHYKRVTTKEGRCVP